jgi:hypothetical protein
MLSALPGASAVTHELLSTLGRLGRQATELEDLLPGARADAMRLFARWSAIVD